MDTYKEARRARLDRRPGTTSQSITYMRRKVESVETNAARLGLRINDAKTKEMRVKTTSNESSPECHGQAMELVESFTNHGSVVDALGGTVQDVAARIDNTQAIFTMLKPVWRSIGISFKTKLRIFRTNVKTFLLYGCKT